MTATQKKEKEGEEGRERREKGQCTAQKMEGVCAPSNFRTGGTRRSKEMGDRRAEGRWKASVEGELHGRVAGELRDRTRQRGREETVCCAKREWKNYFLMQPHRTCAMAKCVNAAGGQWAVKREEEGGRGKRREKQAGQTLLGGQAGRDAHPSTQQKQDIPPVPHPPFTSLNFALERRMSELATRDVRRCRREGEKMKRRLDDK